MNKKKNANANQTMVKLGKIGITPAGKYDAGKTYDKLCLVLGTDGNSYLSTQESVTGVEPGVTEGWEKYWQFLCGSGKGGGVQSDYAQNDETQMDYIKNRPGGYYQTVPGVDIQWDGVVGDKPNVDVGGGMIWVKVSDEILTAEQMIGATATRVQGSGNQSALVTENDIMSGDGFVLVSEGFIVSFSKTTVKINGHPLTVPETGTYFAYMEQDGETTYISGLTKPEVKELVPIPGELTNIKGGYDIPAKTDELLNQTVTPQQWNDGNTNVTLKVAMVEGASVTGTAGGLEIAGKVVLNKDELIVKLGTSENVVLYVLSETGLLQCNPSSIPTTDVDFALMQTVDKKKVTIPEEYVDLQLANVAYSGNYNDLQSKPAIPTVPNKIVQSVNGISPDTNGNVKVEITDVQKENYILRIGEPKYAGYGFAILTANGNTAQMNYANSGIYGINGLSILDGNSQSRFGSSAQNCILITPSNGSVASDISIKKSDGTNMVISSDGIIDPSTKVLKVSPSSMSPSIIRYVKTPEEDTDATNKAYVDAKISDKEIILASSTAGSTKKFKITVDNTGTLSATEVTS